MVVHITSPVSVGVGTTSTRNTSDEIKYTEDNTTGLPGVNYRGAICLNDNGDVSGDYDDMIVRCYKANINNPGQSTATITNVDYTNQGAFYGFPVSTYQNGNRDHIIDSDGIHGNADADDGGLDGTSNDDYRWQRLGESSTQTSDGSTHNLIYMYSAPRSVIISKYQRANPGANSLADGYFKFNNNGIDGVGSFSIAPIDQNGIDIGDTINAISQSNPTKHLIKFTSLDTNSSVSIYDHEKKWMICEVANTPTYNSTNDWWTIQYRAIHGNFNLQPGGGIYELDDLGNVVLEFISPWKNSSGVDQSWPIPLEFFISQESDNNCGFLIQTQKVVDSAGGGTWNLNIPSQFVRGDCNSGPANGFKFRNSSVSVYPNTPYYVWAWSQNGSAQARDPKVKIINVPGGSIPDA